MHGLEHREVRRARGTAYLFETLRQVQLHEGVEHDARRGLDLGQDPLELRGRADQRIDVLDGGDPLVLGHHRAGNGDEGLPGGVRHEVEMEVAAPHTGLLRKELISVDSLPSPAGRVGGPVEGACFRQQSNLRGSGQTPPWENPVRIDS